MNRRAIAWGLLAGMAILAVAASCRDNSTPGPTRATPTGASSTGVNEAGERIRAELEREREGKRAEFQRDRAAIIAKVKRLLSEGKWQQASDLAGRYGFVHDPELEPLEARADAKVAAMREAQRKAEARKKGVSVGMSKEQVLESSWGKPQSVNTTTTAFGVREQWVYGGRNYLYFTDGVLTSIQH